MFLRTMILGIILNNSSVYWNYNVSTFTNTYNGGCCILFNILCLILYRQFASKESFFFRVLFHLILFIFIEENLVGPFFEVDEEELDRSMVLNEVIPP